MAKTRFETLPKNDRDVVIRYVGTHPDVHAEISRLFRQSRDLLQNNIAGLHSRPDRTGYVYNSEASLVAAELGLLGNQITQRGIANRLLHDSPRMLAEGLLLASRIQYLANLAATPEDSGTDCQHVFDLMLSIAAKDRGAVAAYLKRYDYVAKQGHPFTKLLCNGATTILNNCTDNDIVAKLNDRKDSGYDKATLSALAAILAGNRQQVTENLTMMLAGHRRKTINGELLRYFAVPVHALFNMACDRFLASGIPVPAVPDSPLWDTAVQTQLNESRSTEYLDFFAILSPILATWATELPTGISDEAFKKLFAD